MSKKERINFSMLTYVSVRNLSCSVLILEVSITERKEDPYQCHDEGPSGLHTKFARLD